MSGEHAWRGRLFIPEHAHPLVRQMVVILNGQRKTFSELAKISGMSSATLAGWRFSHMPRIDSFEAALNSLGYELQIVPRQPQKTMSDVKHFNGHTSV